MYREGNRMLMGMQLRHAFRSDPTPCQINGLTRAPRRARMKADDGLRHFAATLDSGLRDGR